MISLACVPTALDLQNGQRSGRSVCSTRSYRSVHDITTFPKVAAGSTELGLSGFDERNVPIE